MAVDSSTASQNDTTKEGLGDVQDYYTIDDADKDLLRMINRKHTSVGKEFEDFKKEGKVNERYWNRDHLKTISLRWHQSRIIQNVIYMGVETMVPIITSKPAEPIISVSDDVQDDSEDSRVFTDMLQKVLLEKYNDPDYPQQELMEMLARHLLLYKVGVPKIVWHETLDDYTIEYVHPHKMLISSDGHYNADVWASQYLEKTLKDLIDMFPEKEKDILANIFPGRAITLSEFGDTPVGFWEYHSEDGRYVVWKMQDVVLQKKLNPYLAWNDDKTFNKAANHFDYPKKPVMFLNSQNLGRHIWDDTTPVSQTIPIQDGINLMQRIITDTARDQGIIVGAQELIDRDELYKYTGAPDDKLSVKGGRAADALYRLPPKELAAYVQENLNHLLAMADNIMGTHSTTRGERSTNQTLGQDQLAKEADYGRIDAIVRGIERLSTEIYNWEIQIMMVKYTPAHYAKYLGAEKGQQLFDMMQQYNQKGIKVLVKPGSTLPVDKASQRMEAMELSKNGKLSDIDLFKRMDFPNPTEMAKNAFLQARYPMFLYPDLMQQMQAAGIPIVMVTPKEVMNYKDAPPDIKRQMEQRAGLQPSQLPELQPNNETVAPNQGTPAQTQSTGQQSQPQPAAPADQNAQPASAQPPVDPNAQAQQIQQPAPPQAPPAVPDQTPGGPAAPQPQVGTEHTQAILSGQTVPPFAGIDPSQYKEHLAAEFAFMASPEFQQLPPEIQVAYAKHVIAEREIVMGGGDHYGNPQQ